MDGAGELRLRGLILAKQNQGLGEAPKLKIADRSLLRQNNLLLLARARRQKDLAAEADNLIRECERARRDV
jgi:hypothetical protein